MPSFPTAPNPEPQSSPIHNDLSRLGVVERIQENLRSTAAVVTLRCAVWRVPLEVKAIWDPGADVLRYQNKLERPITLEPAPEEELTRNTFLLLQHLNDLVAANVDQRSGLTRMLSKHKDRERGSVLDARPSQVPWDQLTPGVWNSNRDRVFPALFETEGDYLNFLGELRRAASHAGITVQSDPSVGLLVRDQKAVEKGNAHYPGDLAAAQLISFTGGLTRHREATTVWWDGERFFYHLYSSASPARSRELHLG